ncbi:unnamed protein product [Sympodiomycopsis kandeliae]
MAASVKLALPSFVGLGASVALGAYLWTRLPIGTYLEHVTACDVPARKQLPTDISQGALPQLDNVLCTIAPVYTGFTSNRMNLGSAALVLSVLIPIILRQGYQASSPNNRSSLLGPISVVLLLSLGHFIGHGFAFASVGTLILTMGYYQTLPDSKKQPIPLVPTAAGSVYWVNLALVFFTLSAVVQGFFTAESKYGHAANLIVLGFPLYLPVLLTLATGGVKAPASTAQARRELLKYSAEQVSYAFERTWSYYRKAALVSMGFYWFGLHRFITSIVYQRSYPPQLTAHTDYLIANFLLLTIYAFAVLILERLTIRPINKTIHPVNEDPISNLYLDCQKAIQLAPAGNPGLEKPTNPFFLVLIAVLLGPGLMISLWWSSGEEENGWLARRAWRETSAIVAEKKK